MVGLYISKCTSGPWGMWDSKESCAKSLYCSGVSFATVVAAILGTSWSAFCICKNINFQFPTVWFLACFHDANRDLRT